MAAALIVLAAGQGSRMKSERPKVLHEVAGAPLLRHALLSGAALEPVRTVVVVGHGGEAVETALRGFDEDAVVAVQTEQRGTAHAVAQARGALEGFDGDAFVLYGDTPFIEGETLQRMAEARAAGADVVVLGFEAADPMRYGRLVTDGDRLERIVEFKDATEAERAIRLCNSGVMACDAATMFSLIAEVGDDNASGEFYLTDLPALAAKRGLSARVVVCDESETLGVNTRMDLAAAEAAFQRRARAAAMENGATLVDPATVHFAFDTHLGRDVVVEPHVVFGPGVTVESGATIRAFSHLEGAHVSEACVVGPYARLRPGTELDRGAKVGNFVEVKAAQVDEGAKINHLSYVGDAHVGAHANVGAGTITCNYDGVGKHRTTIGAHAFIGSNTMLVAPVAVGDEAMTGSGSVVTRDVPDGALALSRARQENKDGMARRLMAKLRAAKEAR
ncbi:bifunctional UDP-N-acetylglucosamine diphosphorylase/glucosamine-1-phosphate N-acetyltransferase GlmU [Jannaschia sp. W003]|uniref:bifunctional UDP-N-acetylglucosamine diphosphorylase/glucosamine-1-phosphate N-acetyltransferase GlmU n=1 Tax=Jannaschia sp. W003 TaxID=2867012 RepID=UPI0021A32288|nr:bifunctional UDP-N-acetylglucosamine diphosphorylase/glucosamine-1-phosphate N-acetyltransferase GlmU [Jannaschia sp. W003]UWQ22808.1 bifunctional UDP-N-acetylglucosamine diphosphorylase/glucosamine-1-phosphate N-acetyltransferase GlmU [Jannaschia sp. W003]